MQELKTQIENLSKRMDELEQSMSDVIYDISNMYDVTVNLVSEYVLDELKAKLNIED